MRIWFKIYTDTHLMRDITIENNSDDTRTHKIFKALEDACLAFDLGKPIWLDSNISDFKRHGKTRFWITLPRHDPITAPAMVIPSIST